VVLTAGVIIIYSVMIINDNVSISIVTATYNAEKYLQRLIDSVKTQKNNNVEFIVIDGASVDNTLQIIGKNEKYIDYYVSEKDYGVYDAWNKGIKVAKGKWLMFLGADDVLMPDSISFLIEYIEKSDVKYVDYISAKNIYTGDNGEILKVFGMDSSWQNMRVRMSAAHVGSLHRKELFKDVGLYSLKYRICADYELLLRKKNKLKYRFIDKVIAKMQIGGMSYSVDALMESYLIRKRYSDLPIFKNELLLFYSYLLFVTFMIRMRIKRYING